MIITIDNVWVRLYNFPNNIMRTLCNECRFRPAGYMHSAQYKSGMWDGYTYLLSKATNRARAGLAERIISVLNTKFPDYKYLVTDNRTIHTDERNSSELKINFIPRDYQLEIISKVIDVPKAVIELPTGTGKTKLAAHISAIINKPTVFVAPNLLLLYQTYESFQSDIKATIGIVGDGNCYVPPDTNIVICTAQTLSNILKIKVSAKKSDYDRYMFERALLSGKYSDFVDFLAKTQLLIWDEVHHTAADLYYSATEKLPQITRIYGLSATPYRKDGATLKIEAASGPSVTLSNIGRSYKSMFDNKVLCKPKIVAIDVDGTDVIFNGMNHNALYKAQIVDNTSRNKLIASLALRHRKVVIAVNRIEQGKGIAKQLGSSAVECYATSDDLYSKFKKWKTGKIKVLISTLVDEGFDVPDVDCLIVASPCSDAIQQIGRAIRTHPSKDEAYVYILNDKIKEFKKLNTERYESYSSRFPVECYT